MSNTSHAGPGDKELMKLGSLSPTRSKSSDHALVKTKGGGLGGAGRKTLEDRARSAHEQAAKEDDPTPEMIKANTPEPETTAAKPKATLKKVGWIAEKTTFKSDAEVYAEFDIPPAIADKTMVEFELFRKVNGEFKSVKKVQAHAAASGRAKAVLPVPASEEPKATFAIKVKHCSAEWSSGQGTEREVTETAEISIEHTQVSGIHFPKGKSFIADIYLNTLCEVKKTYLEWKKTHAKAQIVIYGHTEQDEQEDPLNISRNRAMSAYLFVIGDVDLWADLAEKERWGVWEQQCMLRALGFFKAKPTGNLGPITRKAVQDFIAFLNEARCKNINPMLGLSEAYIRKELYREYMNLKRSEIELPSSAFRLVAGYPYVGCCAFNRYQAGETLHEGNRRVVFIMLQESPNFPATFPCRTNSGPCEKECGKPGERAIKGFGCKFYDEMVKQEKVGAAAEYTFSTKIPWLIIAENEAKRWKGAQEEEISKTINYHKEVGVGLRDLSGTDHAWCASFVNYCLKQSGFEMSTPACRARSLLTDPNFVKIEKPIFGSIAVIGTHHVCFVYAKDHKTDRPIFLGGNQSDQVNFTMFYGKITYLLPKRFDASKHEIHELISSTAAELNSKFGIVPHKKSGDTTR